jgi:hypothetical protein
MSGKTAMPTYSRAEYEQIAIAIGRHVAEVLKYERLFEWAADWYWLGRELINRDR